MSQPTNETWLKALNSEGCEPSREFKDISLIMLPEDRNSLDMIAVYYLLGDNFGSLAKDRKLERDELVNVIKSHNPTGYAKLTYDICLQLRSISAMPPYCASPQYGKGCRGTVWVAVKRALVDREYVLDHDSQNENEALSIYGALVKEADNLKARQA